MVRVLFVLALVSVSGVAWAQETEPMPGQKVFGACKSCHAVGVGAKNGTGPELNGLFGRKAGSVEGYAYSDANKNSDLTWSEAVFADYIKDPKAKMPGTKMQYSGLKNPRQIGDLTAYLKTFGADGKPGPQ